MSMSPGSLCGRVRRCASMTRSEKARPGAQEFLTGEARPARDYPLDPPAAAEVDSTAAASPAPSMADVGLDGTEGAGALDPNLEIGQPKLRRESLVPEVPKADEENARIIACLSGHFLFERLSMDKIQQLASAMRRRTTAEDEIVFSQGEMGTTLYVLEDGEYVASVEKDGRSMDLFTYEPNEPHGANPCFGELGVMHVGQREHTVTSLGEGVLWELDRRTFQKVVLFSSRAALLNTLRTVEVFCSLPVASMERLADLLVEVTYQPGETVVRQGEEGTAFFVIAHGRCKVTRSSTLSWEQLLGEYGPGDYFGERALLESEPRAATVAALGPSPLRVLTVSRAAFDDAIGSLQGHDEYASWRQGRRAKEFERKCGPRGVMDLPMRASPPVAPLSTALHPRCAPFTQGGELEPWSRGHRARAAPRTSQLRHASPAVHPTAACYARGASMHIFSAPRPPHALSCPGDGAEQGRLGRTIGPLLHSVHRPCAGAPTAGALAVRGRHRLPQLCDGVPLPRRARLRAADGLSLRDQGPPPLRLLRLRAYPRAGASRESGLSRG